MKYGTYSFSCVVREGGHLPQFKGSAFRGAFGHALKKVVCAVRQKDCRDCLLNRRCLYARVFEVQPRGEAGPSRLAAPPHPYVIEPPLTPQTGYGVDEQFDFALKLFGEFNDYLPYFVFAFEEMGKAGLGSRHQPVRLALDRVTAQGAEIYSGAKRELLPGDWTETAVPGPVPDRPVETLKVFLATPLRLKSDNRLSGDIPFQLLVRAALRRVSSLFETFGKGEPALDYKGLVKNAEAIQTAENNLHWLDIKRYSNRQEQEMLIGGVSGAIVYRGEITPYLPILQLAERFHLGKQTSFGLGQIALEF
ncbi:MAG: CRISPR system precrRNA processing endoribonuclease RAMP protein Cas6 [Deltaproteobacteria bacterium]|nr:CRISPR system precrRNA processing endoribonuclease RAMP protein Cas6 [Deltaproteobacteria bacterium]